VSEIPDYVDPVEGWRLWLAVDDSDSLRLASVLHHVVWPIGEPLVATCVGWRSSIFRWRHSVEREHVAPDLACRCGAYAIRDPRLLYAYFEDRHVHRCARQWVIGRVSLWGTVIESERGWRASYAYPRQLFVPIARRNRSNTSDIVEALGAYGVEVESVDGAVTPKILRMLSTVPP
jgi:hypothetical protein